MLQNIIVDIVLKNGTHIQKEITHLFLCHMQKQVDIVITKDGFQTLVDVVIINAVHVDLV
jgi:hypothetical protein